MDLPTVKTYEDGYSIRARLGELNNCYVDFEIYQGDDLEVRGSVKWDGCMNWETNPRCMFHFCTPADAERLVELFKDVWVEGGKLMGDTADIYYPADPHSVV